MADFNFDDLKRAFKEALDESGRGGGNSGEKDFKSLLSNLTKMDKEIKANTTSMGGLAREMLSGKKVYKDFTAQLSQLDDKIEELADTADESAIAQRQELIQRRQSIQNMQQHNAAQKAAIETMVGFTKAVAGTTTKTVGGLVRGLQSGSSAFALAGGVMEGVIDGANAGMQTLGTGMSAVGTGMSTSLNPRVRATGMAMTGLGVVVGKVSESMAGLTKFVVGYMVKEMEKTVDAFNKTSGAGAMFADGMTGMVNAAHAAGLTVSQFSDVVSKNADNLASSGLGVGQATRMMGQVGDVMRKTGITTNLLKLGYGFQEQAELTAEVMADMRMANSSILKDPAGIAKATESYASNLRVIAAITGEDAKKKLEEARKASSNVAFRAKMMELEKEHPGIYQKYLTASAAMTAQQRQNVQESFVFGGVINETGAMMDASSRHLDNYTKATADSLRNGTLDVGENQKLLADSMTGFRDNLNDVGAIGLAGMAGHLPQLNEALSQVLMASDKITKTAVEEAEKGVAAQKTATDDLTNNTVRAAKAAQDLAIRLENIALSQLSNFAFYSGKIIEALRDQLAQLGISFGGEGGPGFFENIGNKYGGEIGAGIAGAGTAAVGVATGGVGFAGLATGMGMGYTGGQMYGGKAGAWLDNLFGSKKSTGSGQLKFKNEAEGTGGGPTDPRIIEAARLITSQIPGTIVNGFNDLYHQRPGFEKSKHRLGLAADLNVPNFKDPKVMEQINQLVSSLGIKAQDHGDHVHMEAYKNGGVTNGPSVAGEAGPEAVVPLPDGRNIPVKMDMSEMTNKLDEMIRLLRDQVDNSGKMLHAIQ